ncbi:MAG: FadR/GntR family transcriptional regulator [Pseudomonadota bacterium]
MDTSASRKTISTKTDVYLALRDRIDAGEFAVGERLPAERSLSDQFGVARGTLREGLRDLETAGYVERRQGSGTYVVFRKNQDSMELISTLRPMEMVEARIAMEPHICRLAVLHANDEDLQRLDTMLSAMEQLERDPTAFGRVDGAFHLALAEIAGNRLFSWMTRFLSEARTQQGWSQVLTLTLNPEQIRTYNIQHRAIVNAIRKRDPDTATRRMRDHISSARDSLLSIAGV